MAACGSCDLRYVIDDEGKMHEVLEGDELWHRFADSQVSSSWLSCAYRIYNDSYAKKDSADLDEVIVVKATHAEDGSYKCAKDVDEGTKPTYAVLDGAPQLEDGIDAAGSKLSSSEGRLRSRSPKRHDDVSVVSQ